ncbi:putative rhomboid family protein [Blattamonas nauphoetae]|uniref:rhomboid protease n=1 Tax=Blattamonas nauphoetae TaxID=2049346 RepID=A0ABQ9XG91_9EUKA|nr:putative rhomboid family protein [Blattamonas nauphoetae]
MPIHTLGDDDEVDHTEPVQNPWAASTQNNQPDSPEQTFSWGSGQSVSGSRTRDPSEASAQPSSIGGRQPSHSRRSGIHSFSDLDEDVQGPPNAMYQSNARVILKDPLWSNNLPPDQPPTCAQYCLYTCSCGCFVGPCCSPVRKKDWRKFWMMLTPWLTIIQVIMFIVSCCIGGVHGADLAPAQHVLRNMGAKDGSLIKCKGQVFRWLTPVFLHGGIWHLIFNLIFQIRVMLPQEAEWGFWKTFAIYVISAMTGSFYSCLLYPTSISVGASGALMGIYGYYLVDIFSHWKRYSLPQKLIQIISILLFILIMVIIGFTSTGVDNGAHLGGFMGGVALALIIIPVSCWRARHQFKTKYKWSLFIGIVLATISTLLPLILFWTVTNKWLSCT